MDDATRKVGAKAVLDTAANLIVERQEALRMRAEHDRKLRAIDRALFDCRAAGRIFGVDVELPEDVRPGMIIRPPARPATFAGGGPALPAAPSTGGALRGVAAVGGAGTITGTPSNTSQLALRMEPMPAPTVPNVASTTLPAGDEPSIRDLILLYLKQAGADGLKAAILRRKVEAFLNRQIHYKTIGMSLYRLSKEIPPLARRDGLVWFFVPPIAETKNPGASAPGVFE